MTYLILPSILVATALFAGAFALMPIDEAQAVHTTIQATQINQIVAPTATMCNADLDAAGGLAATATGGDFIVYWYISATAAVAPTGAITDGVNTIVVTVLDTDFLSGTYYAPAGTTVTIDDTEATNALAGCATIVAESGATAVAVA